ncbi:Co-chaperone protein HscB-like protein [Bienertia sinuspersici]
MEDDMDTEAYYDQEGPIGQGVGLEDACPHNLNSEPVNKREFMNIEEEGEHNISGEVSFHDPEYRRESVMKHAQWLFRNGRSQFKRKYFNDIRLKTKEERLKNKPSEMIKIEWKFFVDHWSDEKFKEKSKKASESRAHQKMPHYNGTKSFACLRQETRQKDEGKCSRVDVLVASRTRKPKKAVNALTLEKNTLAVDEIKKSTEQRDQGLNDKTDEQIFQDVLGKDTHGYLRAYGPDNSITQHFKVKPSRLDLSQELIEVKKESGSID